MLKIIFGFSLLCFNLTTMPLGVSAFRLTKSPNTQTLTGIQLRVKSIISRFLIQDNQMHILFKISKS